MALTMADKADVKIHKDPWPTDIAAEFERESKNPNPCVGSTLLSENERTRVWIIRLAPGEQVRITFRNDDRGMAHDFGIPAFGVGSGVTEFGTEKSFVFKVPETASSATYICTPHSAMMSGRIFFAK